MTDQSNTNFEATDAKKDSLTNAPTGPVTFGAPTGGLFFSEYVEGSNFNKAVEIFNNTGADVDLSAYAIGRISNGGTDVEASIALSGTLAAGETYVVANPNADAAILAAADQIAGDLSHNGDDHLLLLTDIGGGTTLADGATIVDMIGTPDSGSGFVDPGSQWESGGNGTANQTLRRVSSVTEGSTDGFGADVAKLGTEWEEFAEDTADGLGSHSVDAADPQPTKLLLTELVVTPTGGEFIEIHNPGDAAVDLSNIYLTDATFSGNPSAYYYNLPTGAGAGGGGFSDFFARFPDGASIDAGAYLTVALNGSDNFFAEYGINPDFELYEDAESADAIADMREALPGSINDQGGLSNAGEFVALFEWDGASDLVTDHDYAVWGDKAEAVDKTGISIDGPDGDSDTSTYQDDTAIASQDVIDTGAHGTGESFQRIDLTEGTQTTSGGNGVGGTDETSEDLSNTWTTAAATPGAAAAGGGGGTYTDYMIHAIQGETNLAGGTLVGTAGAADESPLLGEGVRVQAVVTAAFQDAGDIMGFYIQEEDADVDGNSFTSEGIFVSSSSVTVNIGDLVTVEGTVAEVEGETRITADDVTVDSTGNTLPTAATISFPTATVLLDADGDYVANLEAYEGMLVTIDTQMFVTELFQHDRFNTIRISSDGRLEQFTESNAPDVAGYDQHLQDVAARSLILDDGSDAQNVPMEAPGLGVITNANYLTMGDSSFFLTGVLGYGEDDQSSSEEPEYRLRDAIGTWTDGSRYTETPEDVGSDYKVASLNVLNFFTTLDEYPSVGEGSGPNALDPRGADANPQDADPTPGATDEYDRQLAKLVSAIVGMDADVVGLMEIENDFATGGTAPTGTGTVIGSGVAISELVDAVNAVVGAGTYDYVDPGQEFVGGDAIAVGFIYKASTTGLAAGTSVAILDTPEFLDPNNTGEDRNRAALAVTFEELASGETFTAAVNHLKSKGASGLSAGDAGNADSDQGDGAGFWNDTRTKAAQALTDWLATDPTGSGDTDVILLGDYNAYAMEDPIAALEAGADDTPGTEDDFYNYIGAPGYDHSHTYVFDGQTGTLDYAFVSQSLGDQVSGVTVWAINSDESDAFDYNLEFGRDPALYENGARRSSDHDPVIVGLDLGEPAPAADLQITEIWPGQDGTDITADWFEIENRGDVAWTPADGTLYYDDESAEPEAADEIFDITAIAPGERVVVVIGSDADAADFRTAWGDVVDLSNVQIGYTDGSGLGAEGDAVTLFLGTPAKDTIVDYEAYPDTAGNDGQSWDVDAGAFSQDGVDGAVATTVLGGAGGDVPAIGSPGVSGASTPVDNGLTLVANVLGTLDMPEGAEIVAFNPDLDVAYVTSGNGLQVVDVSDPSAPTLLTTLMPADDGLRNGITSVTYANGIFAVAIPADPETDNGDVAFYDAQTNGFLGSVQVGPLPDMVTFDDTGRYVLVANEGESSGAENEPDAAVNPNGSVSIIDLQGGDIAPAIVGVNPTVTTLDFTDASISFAALAAKGVRVNENAPSAAADLEPEYIAIEGTKAFITLQENNAVAVIEDITNPTPFTIDDILPMTLTDHSLAGNELDPSNRDDGINIDNYDIVGMPMPDAIATYAVGGTTYYVTANEGDGRDVDETRGDDINADQDNGNVDAETLAALQDDALLGRLKFSNVDGDTDGDGDIDVLHAFGSRSFSIYDENGTLVFDSGSQFEQITAQLVPELFNSDESDPSEFDSRSDDKGPEPEAVVIGTVGDSVYAFIALERTGGIMVYDITDPANASFDQYIAVEGDVAPEGLVFIAAEDSPTDEALLGVANEVSNTLTFIEFEEQEIFTLELLHVTDQEANASTIDNIDNLSAVLNALRAEDLGNDGVADNTLTLSSGDAIIPGLFFDASEAVFGSAGIADIQIQNELGMQAIAFGNHEFDRGTAFIAGLIDGSASGDFSALSGTALDGLDFTGTDMPYLSANLDFSTDPNLAPLEIAGGQAPQGNVVSSSTVIEEGGEKIGIVGATTPLIDQISSAGSDLGITPEDFDTNPTSDQLDALAAEIQAEVDALLAANPDMNKVILLAHMQQIEIEQELAARLTDVDIIVAGGSNTRLFDDNDRARAGDSDQGQYPIFVTDAGGNTTAIVNTDAQYKYVGRLVIDFDEDGNIIPESYDETVSGAYATDDQGVADLGAEGLVDPEIDAITDAIQAQIVATESNVFGVSDVFLNGNRSGTGTADDPDGVRTQETNLGNLTADANLAYANDMVTAHGLGDPVLVSIKNGGGIRANIGQIVVPGGGGEYVRSPNEAVFDENGVEVKPEGGISQNDIASVLAFNNGLALVDMTKQELVDTLEGGVSALPSVNGGFPQISGVEFSFDPAATAGDRIQDAAIVDENGDIVDILVRDGEIFGATDTVYRVVTLNFLLDFGDPILSALNEANLSNPNRVDLFDLDGDGVDDGATTGAATFSDDGTEQDALAEYLNANFNPANGGTAYDEADTGPDTDGRIQNLAFRDGDVLPINELLIGTDNLDVIAGKDGDDVIIGLKGNDVLRGGSGDDELIGNAGRDLLVGGEGADILDGGNDVDFAHYRASSAGVTIDLRSNTFTGGDAQGDTLIRVEGIGGSMFDDILGGTADRNIIEGYDGDDQIFGRGGNDLLIGGAGADLIDGGAGDDRVDYSGSAAGVDLNLVSGVNTGGDAAGDTLISIEQIVGSDLADRIIATNTADVIFGGDGDDFLNGRDRADRIIGGLGDDILKGGRGADTFRFVEAEFGEDEIRDWEDGRDMLDFRALGLGYADFTKTQDGTDTVLTLTADTDQSVTLKNTDAALIDGFDFL